MTIDYNPSSERLNRAILLAVQAGSIGVAALLRAVRDGRIALFICQPENASDFKTWAAKTAGQPVVCLVGDDDGLERGYVAWRGYAFRMFRWSDRVLVHAAGADVAHYEAAILAAEEGDRVLVIETGSIQAERWLQALATVPRRPTLLIWPKEDVHPIPVDRRRAH
jgi:hypothetical protein